MRVCMCVCVCGKLLVLLSLMSIIVTLRGMRCIFICTLPLTQTFICPHIYVCMCSCIYLHIFILFLWVFMHIYSCVNFYCINIHNFIFLVTVKSYEYNNIQFYYSTWLLTTFENIVDFFMKPIVCSPGMYI